MSVPAKPTLDELIKITEEAEREEMSGTLHCPARNLYNRTIFRSDVLSILRCLSAIAKAAPRECICHVRSFDGFYGSKHTEPCVAYLNALMEVPP